MDRLMIDGAINLGQPLTRGDVGASIVAVGELQARYFAEVLSIPRALQGWSRDAVLKQPPTLPTQAAAQKKGLIAVLATLGSGFALLLFVFIRQALRNTAADAEAAGKLARIRRALGLK